MKPIFGPKMGVVLCGGIYDTFVFGLKMGVGVKKTTNKVTK